MDFGIKEKIALVTAASKGLGRGSALALAAEGCRVAISARTQADVEQTAKELAAQTKAEVTPFVGDMSKPEEIERLLDNVRSRLGEPDIVVCNAGGPPPGNFATTKIEQFLPARAVALQLLDDINTLLQHYLLAFKLVHLRFQLFQPGLLARLLLNVQTDFDNLLVGGVPVVIKHAEGD